MKLPLRRRGFRDCSGGPFRCVVPVDLKASNSIRHRVINVPRQHAKTTVAISPFNEYGFKHSDRYAEERSLVRELNNLDSLLDAAQMFHGERDDEEGDIEPFEDGTGYAFEWGSYDDFGDS
jgi:hypothetical protein